MKVWKGLRAWKTLLWWMGALAGTLGFLIAILGYWYRFETYAIWNENVHYCDVLSGYVEVGIYSAWAGPTPVGGSIESLSGLDLSWRREPQSNVLGIGYYHGTHPGFLTAFSFFRIPVGYILMPAAIMLWVFRHHRISKDIKGFPVLYPRR